MRDALTLDEPIKSLGLRPPAMACLAVLFLYAYRPVLAGLWAMGFSHDLLQQAPFVLAIAIGFAVQRLRQGAPPVSDPGSVAPFMIALSLNVAGQLVDLAVLSQLSLPLALAGMALALHGKALLRRLRVPLLYLCLAIPLPGSLYLELVAPLKLLVSRLAADLLVLGGVPVVRAGNILTVGTLRIGVTDACAGLSSLMTVLALAVAYTLLRLRTPLGRLLVIGCMPPLIVLANVLRVAGLTVVAIHFGSNAAFGESHALWGLLVFVGSVSGLLLLTALVARTERKRLFRS
jgi:exosortase